MAKNNTAMRTITGGLLVTAEALEHYASDARRHIHTYTHVIFTADKVEEQLPGDSTLKPHSVNYQRPRSCCFVAHVASYERPRSELKGVQLCF